MKITPKSCNFVLIMKLFTNEQIRTIERHTIETEGIPPGEIIERVAEGVAGEMVPVEADNRFCRSW